MAQIKSRKKLVAIVTAALLVAGGSSAAFAYWTSTGSGTDTATTGTTNALVVTSTGPTGATALVPGGASQFVEVTVANPAGAGTQYLTNLSAVVAEADGTAWNDVTGCSDLDYTVTVPAATAYQGQIAAGDETLVTVEIKMNNLPKDQNACKGADVPLFFTAS